MSRFSYRVFVSSPGDVGDERRIAVRVAERLQGRYGAILKIEPIVWEHEPVRATATFQQQITPPADTDVVVCILWSRLGTRLPADFHRADGSVYESGTAFEFETAKAACDADGRPDLLVYRKTAAPIVDVRDRRERELRSDEWDRLATYLDHWFRNPDGSFKAGFTTFERPDEFEDALERHLDGLIRERLAGQELLAEAEQVASPTWLHGSPFRGLEVFEVEHAGIFHGRTRAIAEAKDRLSRQATVGTAFLLIYGMSGSGKSSLVRAGLLPTIIEPGVVEGIGLWRYCILRPSQGPDPLAALIASLSRAPALPELASGDFSYQELLALVGESPQRLIGPLRSALHRAAERLMAQERLGRLPKARLAVVVDQLEELFTDERIDKKARLTFIDVLAELSRSGLGWVICTMRSDLFHRCSEVPVLVALKDGLGSYELLPPVGAEIGQMIRNPARAAGLRFEEDPGEGRLDDVLQEAASRDPTSLPLMEFMLDALYQASGESRLLTFAAYRSLDRLEGAIAKRAENLLNALPAEVQAALPVVLRALVTVKADPGAVTARVAPMAQLRSEPQRRALADALVDARLLVTDGEGDEAVVVRVAHEALLNRWPRAREIIRESRDDLLTRERVSADASLWERDEHNPELLLPAGKRLAEATDLLARRREELDRRLVDYIEHSQAADDRRRRRRTTWVAGAFFVLTGLLVAALWQWHVAREQTRLAQEQKVLAEQQAALALSRQIATHAEESLAQRNYQLALLLAAEASQRASTREADAVLKAALEKTPLLERTLWVPAAWNLRLAFSPDGARLAAYYRLDQESPTLAMFEVPSGRQLSPQPLEAEVASLAWGHQLIGAWGEELLLFDQAAVIERVPLQGCREVRDLGADPGGTVTIACSDQLMRLTKDNGRWRTESFDFQERRYFTAVSGDGRHALCCLGDPAYGHYLWHAGDRELTKLNLSTPADTRLDLYAERMAIDLSGRRIAIPTVEGTFVWALDGSSLPLALLATQGRPIDLIFAPDGHRLAVSYDDGRIEIWNVGSIQLVVQPLAAQRQDDEVKALALSPDRSMLAAGTATGLLALERLGPDRSDAQVLNGWRGPIQALLFTPPAPGATASAQDSVVVVEEGNSLVVRRVSGREPVGKKVPIQGRFLAATTGLGGEVRTLVMGSDRLTLENLSAGTSLQLEFPTKPTPDLENGGYGAGAFSRDGRIVAFADLKGHVWLYGSRGQLLDHIQLEPAEGSLAADARLRVAVGAGDLPTVIVGWGGRWNSNPLYAWSPDGGSAMKVWEGDIRYSDLFDVDVAPAGDLAAAAIYSVGTDQLLMWERIGAEWREQTLEPGGKAVAFDSSATEVAVASRQPDSGEWLVRRVALSGEALGELQGPRGEELVLEHAGSGHMLAAATERDIRVWDLQGGTSLDGVENLLADGVGSLAFEDEGRRLAAAEPHGAVVRWSLASRLPTRTATEASDQPLETTPCSKPNDGPGTGALELSTGITLALCTAMVDGNNVPLQVGMIGSWAVTWEVPTGDWIQRACRQAGANLGSEEWVRYVGETISYRETCPGLPARRKQ